MSAALLSFLDYNYLTLLLLLGCAVVMFINRKQVEYQLEETEFLIPALAVQPIVENAIRHGLGSKGGIVRLSTCRSGEDYLITVTDNGAGMGVSTDLERERLGAGIENVRTRLKMQCGGSLSYSSGPEGTVAVLRIPVRQVREQEEDSASRML